MLNFDIRVSCYEVIANGVVYGTCRRMKDFWVFACCIDGSITKAATPDRAIGMKLSQFDSKSPVRR